MPLPPHNQKARTTRAASRVQITPPTTYPEDATADLPGAARKSDISAQTPPLSNRIRKGVGSVGSRTPEPSMSAEAKASKQPWSTNRDQARPRGNLTGRASTSMSFRGSTAGTAWNATNVVNSLSGASPATPGSNGKRKKRRGLQSPAQNFPIQVCSAVHDICNVRFQSVSDER